MVLMNVELHARLVEKQIQAYQLKHVQVPLIIVRLTVHTHPHDKQ